VAQVAEHLPSEHKALSSNPNTTRKRKEKQQQQLWGPAYLDPRIKNELSLQELFTSLK
jgi:hypothetical protein